MALVFVFTPNEYLRNGEPLTSTAVPIKGWSKIILWPIKGGLDTFCFGHWGRVWPTLRYFTPRCLCSISQVLWCCAENWKWLLLLLVLRLHRWMESPVIIKFRWEYPPVVILMRGRSIFILIIVFGPQLIFKYQDDNSLKAVLTSTILMSKYLCESIFITCLPLLQVKGSNAAWQQEGCEFNSQQEVCKHSVFPNSGFYLPAWCLFKQKKWKTVESAELDRRNTFGSCASNAARVSPCVWQHGNFDISPAL